MDFVELGSKDVLYLVEVFFLNDLVIRTVKCVYYFVSLLLKSMLFHNTYLIATLKIGCIFTTPVQTGKL